jgi:hypothetical protein
MLMDTLLVLECINCSCECLGQGKSYLPLLASIYRESNITYIYATSFRIFLGTILTFSCRDVKIITIFSIARNDIMVQRINKEIQKRQQYISQILDLWHTW